jgi:hypothetical protein
MEAQLDNDKAFAAYAIVLAAAVASIITASFSLLQLHR